MSPPAMPTAAATDIIRPHAEDEYAAELAALIIDDDRPRPPQWHMSPWAVVTYLLERTDLKKESSRFVSIPAPCVRIDGEEPARRRPPSKGDRRW